MMGWKDRATPVMAVENKPYVDDVGVVDIDISPKSWRERAEPVAEEVVTPISRETPKLSPLEKAEGMARSYTQGMTSNFGDEAIAALASLPSAALTGMSIPDAYNAVLADERSRQKRFASEVPVADISMQILGGGALGGGLSKAAGVIAPKGAAALSQFAARNPVKAGALTGAASGAGFGLGSGEGTQDRLQQAALSGGLGAVTGGIAGGITGALSKPKQKAIASMDDLRAEAGGLYKAAYETGAGIKPDFTNKLLDDLTAELSPKTKVDQAFQGESPALKAVERLGVFKDRAMPIDELHSLEKNLGALAEENVVAGTGKLNSVGNQAKQAQRLIRQTIENMSETDVIGGKSGFDMIKQANDIWARSNRLATVEKVVDAAKMMEQPSTSLRSGFRTILKDKNRKRAFTADELKAMKVAGELDMTTAGLRMLGSRLPATFAAGGAAFTGFNPAALAGTAGLAAVSGVARKAADSRQMAKADLLLQLISNPNVLERLASAPAVGASGITAGMLSSKGIEQSQQERQ